MTKYFLKVDKSLFNCGLNPLEILLVSQIAEFENNTGDCFISDKTLAENFGVSEKTVSRALKALEDKGFIVRNTKNCRGGRERHIALATDKMTLDEELQQTKSPLPTDKMTFDNGQNDFIKDNIIDKEKDNKGVEFLPTAESSTLEKIQKVSKQWLEENGIEYELIIGNWGEIKATGAKIEVLP